MEYFKRTKLIWISFSTLDRSIHSLDPSLGATLPRTSSEDAQLQSRSHPPRSKEEKRKAFLDNLRLREVSGNPEVRDI
jgi:hypothetical protein